MTAKSVTGIGNGSAEINLIRSIKDIQSTLEDIPIRNNYVVVQSVDDLPPSIGGEHVLVANTVYEFHGVVTSQYGLRFTSGATVKGSSLGSGVFYYVGTGAALRSSGIASHVICSYLSVFAPNGSAMLFSGDINYQLMLFFCGFFNCKAIGTLVGLMLLV